MADMFAPLVAQLKANPKTIVFTEGNDPRILEAAAKLLAEGVLKVVMVGNEAECKAAAAAGNFDISAAEIIDRAIARGELDPGIDIEFALDLFPAPIYWRLLVRDGEIEPEYLDKLTDFIIRGLGAH